MKNLIINIFKTLFFFDLAVIVIPLLPVFEKKNPALTRLINEAIPLGFVLALTLVYVFLIEKRAVTIPFIKKKVKLLLKGLGFGAAIPILFVVTLAILKHFDYIGFNKVSHSYYWILAILCNIIASELLFRGYLFSLYKKFYGFTFAAVCTTALYLSANFNIFSKDTIFIANIILLNILLCFLLEYSGSVLTTITAHFAYILLSTFALGSYPLTSGYPVLINHKFSQNKFFVGNEYPLEGSKFLLIILSIITLIFVVKKYQPITQFKKLILFVKSIPERNRARKFRKLLKPKKIRTKKVKVKR